MMNDIKSLFYQAIKVCDRDDNIFWWSDAHMGHLCEKWPEPLWAKRGHPSVEAHDEANLQNWNAKVGKYATVFFLGDVLFGFNGKERLLDYLKRLNFKTLYIMPGNHHAGWRQVFESVEGNKLQVDENKTVIFVPNYLEAFVNGQAIVMSHYAVASWNGQGKGSWMIHGHSHGSLYNGELGKILYTAKIVDVGPERFDAPVSFGELRKLMSKSTVSFDHHDRNTQSPF